MLKTIKNLVTGADTYKRTTTLFNNKTGEVHVLEHHCSPAKAKVSNATRYIGVGSLISVVIPSSLGLTLAEVATTAVARTISAKTKKHTSILEQDYNAKIAIPWILATNMLFYGLNYLNQDDNINTSQKDVETPIVETATKTTENSENSLEKIPVIKL